MKDSYESKKANMMFYFVIYSSYLNNNSTLIKLIWA